MGGASGLGDDDNGLGFPNAGGGIDENVLAFD